MLGEFIIIDNFTMFINFMIAKFSIFLYFHLTIIISTTIYFDYFYSSPLIIFLIPILALFYLDQHFQSNFHSIHFNSHFTKFNSLSSTFQILH